MRFIQVIAVAALLALTGCQSASTPNSELGSYPEAPRNEFADISFEASVMLCFRQPNYPMCALDCIERPERQGWNDWCELPPAPADKLIDPSKYSEEELLAILQEDFE